MLKRIGLTLSCLALVAFASCVESKNPLSDPVTSQQDPQLYGLWTNTNAEGDIAYIVVGAENSEPLDPKRDGPEPGLMRYWSITLNNSGHKVEEPEGTRFFCTKIGEDHFASWVTPLDKRNPKPTTYFFLKYQVEGKKLHLWIQDPEQTAQAIEAGKLKGTVKRKAEKNAEGVFEIQELQITDSTQNIVAFLAAGGAKTCFPDKHHSVYTRLP